MSSSTTPPAPHSALRSATPPLASDDGDSTLVHSSSRGEKTDDEATGLDSGWREQPDRDPFIDDDADEPVSDDEQSIAEGAERLRAFRLLPLQEQQRINRERALVIGATWQPPTAAEDKANYAAREKLRLEDEDYKRMRMAMQTRGNEDDEKGEHVQE